jgi:MFS family permease
VFSLLGGVVADRFDRKRVMVAADAVRAVAAGLLAVSIVAGHATFGAVLAVALIEGIGMAFFGPASSGALRSVVPPRQLPDAASTTQARFAAVRLIGPPLGGALYGIARAVPFVFDALTYAASLVTVLLMRTPFQEAREAAAPEKLRAQLRDGVRFLWRQRFLRAVALLLTVLNIVAPGTSLALVVVGRAQGLSGGAIGALVAAVGAAMLAGSLASPFLRRRLGARRVLLLEVWTWVGTAAFVVWPDVYVLAAAMIPCGFAIPNSDATIAAYVLTLAPDRIIGRVDSVLLAIGVAATPLGTLGAGIVLGAAGARATVGLLAGIALVLAIATTLNPAIRSAPPLGEPEAST